MSCLKRSVAVVLLAACFTTAHADGGVFHIETEVSGNRTSTSFATIEDAFDALKGGNLGTLNPAYTGTQAAQVSIDYRGVSLSASYAGAGSSQLNLSIPSIGLEQVFNAGTRDATQKQLKDFFKQNTDDVLGRLSKGLARSSAIDPIAGNPNSLMSQLVAQDFAAGFFEPIASASGHNVNLVGTGVAFGQYRQAGVQSRAYTLPLSYTVRSDDAPGRQLSIRMPLTMIDTDGSKSYTAGLGGSLRLPVTDRWALTPALDYAAAGSRDLGSLAGMASASITSSYTIPFAGFDLSIGDMVGYYKATRVKSGDYGYDPGISNTVVRNGVMVAQRVGAMALEYSIVDTHFFGDSLYVQHTDEFGVSIGTDRRTAGNGNVVRAGAGYLYASKAKGFMVRASFTF